jgi:hypothetical protein
MVDKEKYISKFKKLYKEKNGSEISDTDALECFEKLITLILAIYRPIPSIFFEDFNCVTCLQKVKISSFKNQKNIKEFLISGICQECQDKTFK